MLTALTLAIVAVIRIIPTVEALDSEEQAFLQLINTYRQQNGLQPLNLSPTLTTAAKLHSQDMADNNYFSHTSLDGRTFDRRIRDAGYTYDTWLGENIAAGYSTAESVFKAWKNSSSHNANMLRPQFKVMGIGRAYNASSYCKWYWTTDFGGYDDSGSGETATTIFTTTTTVLATQTTPATTTVTTTSTSTLTQTSTRTLTTATSTSTVSLTTLTTTLDIMETASSTTYITRLTTATTTAYFISSGATTVSTTENRTYTFLTTYSYVSTSATTTSSTITDVHVTTLTAGVTTETSTSTVEEKATTTEIMVETSTRTLTTLSFSTKNVTVTLTEPIAVTETITGHQRAPTAMETDTKTIPGSAFSWNENLPPLLTTVSLAAAVAVFATRVLHKH